MQSVGRGDSVCHNRNMPVEKILSIFYKKRDFSRIMPVPLWRTAQPYEKIPFSEPVTGCTLCQNPLSPACLPKGRWLFPKATRTARSMCSPRPARMPRRNPGGVYRPPDAAKNPTNIAVIGDAQSSAKIYQYCLHLFPDVSVTMVMRSIGLVNYESIQLSHQVPNPAYIRIMNMKYLLR